ncbi:protein of unknown function (plasmid) [Azospirillum lipoferum 4B]|uniref:Uncharacterized protein n=1 Tax=Azospirillum lipoferum (strain 4B) TaxID=862719 RepID=G7ZHS9_AZOL4|nr:protein of unknown function [Azospirillum lipoferum 4B]
MIKTRAGATPCTRSGQTIGDSMPILSEVSTVRVLVRNDFHKSQRCEMRRRIWAARSVRLASQLVW